MPIAELLARGILGALIAVTLAAGADAMDRDAPETPLLASAAAEPKLDLDRQLSADATKGCREDVQPPAARTDRPPETVKVLPPASGVYVGLYQIPAWVDTIQDFTVRTGVSPPIVFTFHDWYSGASGSSRPTLTFSDPLEGERNIPPLELAEALHRRGSVLALAWAIYCCDIDSISFWLRLKKPFNHFARILAGEDDAFIRTAARQIKAYGGPIMLTLVPEMSWQGQFAFGRDGRSWMDAVDNICNQYGDPGWPDGPERIRDLFIHVIDIFRSEGVGNVTWFMYSGNQYMAPSTEGQSRWLHPKYYYPGDAYIDWVGQSVYFTDPRWPVDKKEDTGDFESVFGPGYGAWRSVTSRPMFLPEFGIIGTEKIDRSPLLRKTFAELLRSVPEVRAVAVADAELFEKHFQIPRISRRPAEVSALREVVRANTYYVYELRVGSPPR